MTRKLALLTCLCLTASLLLALAPPAQATLPGANGRIFFEQGKNIRSITPEGTGNRLEARGNDFPGGPNLEDVSVSPNGKKIAVSTSLEIWVVTLANDRRQNVTGNASGNLTLTHLRFPSWSPNGNQIAFQAVKRQNGTDYARIYRINADGTGIRQVIKLTTYWGDHETYLDWGSSNKIAYSADDDLYTIKPDGSQWTNLTDDLGVYAEPSWSPDATKIAVDHEVDGTGVNQMPGVVVLDANTGAELTAVTGNQNGTEEVFDSPTFSPAGDFLAFDGYEAGKGFDFDIFKVVNAANGTMTDLNTLPAGGGDSYDPAWGVAPAP